MELTNAEFKRQVHKLMCDALDDTPRAHYAPCPECDEDGHHKLSCVCDGAGCEQCKGTGTVFAKCETCKGAKKVWVTADTGLDIFEDVPLAEALRITGNKLRRLRG
jgi:DnaJ-class molecular chaperone